MGVLAQTLQKVVLSHRGPLSKQARQVDNPWLPTWPPPDACRPKGGIEVQGTDMHRKDTGKQSERYGRQRPVVI